MINCKCAKVVVLTLECSSMAPTQIINATTKLSNMGWAHLMAQQNCQTIAVFAIS